MASAMTANHHTLIGITPLDAGVPLSVGFEVDTTQQYVLHNLRSNVTRAGSGIDVTIDGTYAQSQIFLLVTSIPFVQNGLSDP